MGSIGQKKHTPAKQPFMFLSLCFLLNCRVKRTAFLGLERCQMLHKAVCRCHMQLFAVRRRQTGNLELQIDGLWCPSQYYAVFLHSAVQKLVSEPLSVGGQIRLAEKHGASGLGSLVNEKPAKLMAQIRGIWPQVEQALRAGHTLKVVHERLNAHGIPISYKLLTAYRSRIRREKKVAKPPAAPIVPPIGSPPDVTPTGFDPLANFREQEQKAVTWKYPSGPPDEKKLI
jgi:hypothetical protein